MRAPCLTRYLAGTTTGSRILEDQLRLMDEKYVELRTKLDWTRSTSQREVKRIQKDANRMRAKFALAAGTDPALLRDDLMTPGSRDSRSAGMGSGQQRGYGKSASEAALRPSTMPTPMGSQSAALLPGLPQGADPSGGALPAIDSLGMSGDDMYRPRE